MNNDCIRHVATFFTVFKSYELPNHGSVNRCPICVNDPRVIDEIEHLH